MHLHTLCVPWQPGVYGTDASGGRFSSVPSLRRCGCGIVQIDSNLDLLFESHFPLPGAVQTIPRAELAAIARVVVCVSHGTIVIHSDSKVNIDMYLRPRSVARSSINGDLWTSIFTAIDQKALILRLSWVKGHLDTVDSSVPFTDHEYALNFYADRAAGIAAHDCQIYDRNISMPVLNAIKIVGAIGRRLSAIIVSGMLGPKIHHAKNHAPPKPAAPTLQERVDQSSHYISLGKCRAYCFACNCSVSIKSPNFSKWVETKKRAIRWG